MDSLIYYQSLNKTELKYRLKLAIAKLNDAKYKSYLVGTPVANEYIYQEDVDNIQAALSMPRKKVSAKKTTVKTVAKALDAQSVDGRIVYELHSMDGSFVETFDTKLDALAAKSAFDDKGVAVEFQVGLEW